MIFSNISNPRWVDAAHTTVALTLDIPELNQTQVDFNATADDVVTYGVSLYESAVAEEFGPITAFVAPAPQADIVGFLAFLKSTFGIISANALTREYPLFFTEIQNGEWSDAGLLIIDAHSRVIITDEQYAFIKDALIAYAIPLSLP